MNDATTVEIPANTLRLITELAEARLQDDLSYGTGEDLTYDPVAADSAIETAADRLEEVDDD